MKTFGKNSSIIGFWLIFSMFLISCGSVTSLEVPVQKLKIKATGPLFEGVNTATCDFKIGAMLPEDVNVENIYSATIASFKIIPVGSDYSEVKGGTSLLASPSTSMQEFGFTSGSSENGLEFKLTENQTFLVDILKDSSQTLVFDFTINEDYFENMEFEAQIKWNIQLKQ